MGLFSFLKPESPSPIKNFPPVLQIRFEAIGGQGAHSTAVFLSEFAVMKKNWKGNQFSSFGSEKRGSPVQSFVRLSKDGIPSRSASPIVNPDVLVIFHDSLLHYFPDVLSGVKSHTRILLGSERTLSELKNDPALQIAYHSLWRVSAKTIAKKNASRLNMPILGALNRMLGCFSADEIIEHLANYYQKANREERLGNQKSFQEGFESADGIFGDQALREYVSVPESRVRTLGGVIHHPGNSILKHYEFSRIGTKPLFQSDLCISCGYCDLVCPDFCFEWEKKPEQEGYLLKGYDEAHCKGCGKCIQSCPTGALTSVSEFSSEMKK